MKVVLGILLGAVLLVGEVKGQGTLVNDQSAGGSAPGEGLWIGVQTNAPLGQSFTPALNSIGYIALGLNGSGTATFYMNLRSGSITGAILGSTTPTVISSGAANGIYDFYFPSAISLTPGTAYFLDVNQSAGSQWLINSYSYQYADGIAYFKGVPSINSDDLWFREGIVVVPEPSVAWLALVGGGIFFSARRWPKSPES
jgi:hypothetical protein